MYSAESHPFLVPSDSSFRVAGAPTHPAETVKRKLEKKKLENLVEELSELQQILFAHDEHAVLLIFQGMDAAGKDSTIRAVMSGINPAGCEVYSFRQPSALELDHDFLWRSAKRLPQRGRIGIFNRSYYEEVLVVRVHPTILNNQKLPDSIDLEHIWRERFESICDHEKHLARNGVVILKFWLNISKEEQKRRFLSRLDEPEKQWKASARDVDERRFWDRYMQAYEEALNATSKPWAPWYAIPADHKPYMRRVVAEIVVASLNRLGLRFPELDSETESRLGEIRKALESEEH